MNSADTPPDPAFSPPVRTCRNDWWRVLVKAFVCFTVGLMISTGLVGKTGYAAWYSISSRSKFGAHSVSVRLLGEEELIAKEPLRPEERRQYVKEAFARQLQGMTWTWDNELKPRQP